MKYADGQEVRLGDRAKLGQDDGGVVVASIDTGEYSAEHAESHWNYLKPIGRRLGNGTFGCNSSRIAERMAPMARSCSVIFFPVASRAVRIAGPAPCWRRGARAASRTRA
jgi:hypothetical protein